MVQYLKAAISLFFMTTAAAALAKKGDACVATPTGEASGPLYRFGAERKSTVCDVGAVGSTAIDTIYQATPKWCFDKGCFQRHLVPMERGIRVKMSGTIKDRSCQPIPGAELDIWQATAHGVYGSLRRGAGDGFCRAIVVADEKGRYTFDTEIPGAYGILNGAISWFDLPPFTPQHIHVLISEKGYRPLIAQVFIPGDPARGHDWRQASNGGAFDLGSTDPALQLNITACPGDPTHNCAQVDLILDREISVAVEGTTRKKRQLWSSAAEREEAIHHAICENSPLPPTARAWAVCFPWVVPLLRWRVILAVVLLSMAAAGFISVRTLSFIVRFVRRATGGSKRRKAD